MRKNLMLAGFMLSVLPVYQASAEVVAMTCFGGTPQVTVNDADGDTIPDAADRDPANVANACTDYDGDLLNDLREYQLGTDPVVADTDGDGGVDGKEVIVGLDPLDPSDALLDFDGDGFLNLNEALARTNPFVASSHPPALPAISQALYSLHEPLGELDPYGAGELAGINFIAPSRVELIGAGASNTSGQRFAADYIATQGFLRLTFDADALVKTSYPIRQCVVDPDFPQIQVEEQSYLDQAYLVPTTLADGSVGVYVHLIYRTYLVECDLTEYRRVAGNPYIIKKTGDSGVLLPDESVYVLPLPKSDASPLDLSPRGRLSLFADHTGINAHASLPVVWSNGPSGELVVRYGNGAVSRYHLVSRQPFYDLVLMLHEAADGSTEIARDFMAKDLAPNWPAPEFTHYTNPWDKDVSSSGFAMAVRTGIGISFPTYTENSIAGTGVAGTWYDSYLDEFFINYVEDSVVGSTWNGAFLITQSWGMIADPAECEVVTCVSIRDRIMELLRHDGNEVVMRRTMIFYEPYDSNSDGLIDTQGAPVDEWTTIHRYVLSQFADLDGDGVPDDIDLDDDGDGLPDQWEAGYSASTSGSFMLRNDAQDDPDGDKITNLVEYQLGLDPMMPDDASVLRNSLVLRRSDDSRWYNYTFGLGQIIEKGFLPLTRSAAFSVVSRADFDGDGQPDLLLRDLSPEREQNGRWLLYTLDGNTVTAQGYLDALTRNSDWELLASEDISGDGKADLLLRNKVSGRWLSYLMDGHTVTSQATLTLSLDLSDSYQGMGDFNGDGRSDVLLRRADGGWLMYGLDGLSVIFSGTPPMTSNSQFSLQALSDFDGDGKTDALLRRADGRWFMYLLSWAAVTGQGSPAMTEATSFEVKSVADFNADGKSDILLRRNTDGRWFMYTMSGVDVLDSGAPDMTRNLAFGIVSTGDFSGDGKADVLMRREDGRWILYMMNGPMMVSKLAPDFTRNPVWVPYSQ